MGLDGCGQMCKCILIIFNIVLAIVGCAMLGLGLWLRFSSETRGFFDIDFNTQEFVIGVTVLMVLGAMLLLVSVVGDSGICSENRGALIVFSWLLAILAGALLAAGVLAYVRSDYVSERLTMFYATVYAQYVAKGDPAMAITLTLFHNALQCCGVVGGIFDIMVKKTCPEQSFLETLTTPSKPCPPVIINLFEEKAPLVMGLFLGTAALLIMAMVLSSLLSKEIQRSRVSPATYVLLSSPAPPLPDPYQDPVVFTPLTLSITTAGV